MTILEIVTFGVDDDGGPGVPSPVGTPRLARGEGNLMGDLLLTTEERDVTA